MKKVRFSAFADLHHTREFKVDAPARLAQIQARAAREKVDFIIHLGDLCHRPKESQDFLDQYNDFAIPSYHVLGNHDSDHTPLAEVVKLYKMPAEYYYFDVNGFRFIVLNSNYYRYENQDIAYSMGNYYKYPEYRDYLPQEQVVWLKEVLLDSPYINVILSHNNLALDDFQGGNGLKNKAAVQDVLRQARQAGRPVLLCINGHLHVDYMRIYENVCYFDLNSAAYDWLGVKHDYYPKEIVEQHSHANHTIIYNDPVHAIISLQEDGTIEIEGMQSSFFMGVDREMVTGKACHNAIRSTPHVLSAKLRMFI